MEWIPVIFVFFIKFISPGLSRSTGAPAEACATLMPQHGGNTNQTSAVPYELDTTPFQDPGIPMVNGNLSFTFSYTPSRSYRLVFKMRQNVNSPGFRGFFTQARLMVDNRNIGGFQRPRSDDTYQLSSCVPPTFGATHRDNYVKSTVTVRWTAPPNDTGAISFRYTFVQDFNTFWYSLTSVPIIERRCPVRTGRPYYHAPTSQCLQQCPPGYMGSYSNSGICQQFVATDPTIMSFTVDLLYLVLNSTSIVDNAVVLEYVLMIKSSAIPDTNTIFSISLNLISTTTTEAHFRLSNGRTQIFVFRDDLEALNADVLFYRGSIHVINTANFDITQGDFVFTANLVIFNPLLEAISNFQTVFIVTALHNPCNSNPCMDGGNCVLNNGVAIGYICECYPDYTGPACNGTINNCIMPTIDCNNGTCTDGNQTFSCMCYAGYTGDRCEVDIDECAAMNCANGKCTDLINDYNCSCYTGWEGRNCDFRINYCAGDPRYGPCNQIGSVRCENGNSTFECLCLIGFTGELCEIDIDDCVPDNPCGNGRNCTDRPYGAVECECPPEFSGLFCEVDLTPCDPLPCNNNRVCTDLGMGNYMCNCTEGFSGTNCEVDVDVCTSSTCLNGGMCSEGVGASFSCMCMPGHTGARCEEEILFCTDDTCFNGGACMEEVGVNVSCNCLTGFSGDSCEMDINTFCTDSACTYNGVCVEGYGASTSCICNPRYSGINCEVDKCDFFTCLNGGACTENSDAGVVCRCSEGFEGTNCEHRATVAPTSHPVTSCSNKQCLNGGMCTNVNNLLECVCLDPWKGSACEECTIPNCKYCTYNGTENVTKCSKCNGAYSLDSFNNCICSIANCLRCSEEGEICHTCQNEYETSSNMTSCIQDPSKFNPLGIVVGVLSVAVGSVFAVMISLVLYFCIFYKKQVSKEKPDTDECALPNPSYFDVKLKDIVKKDVGHQEAMYY